MSPHNLRIWTLVQACIARIESYKAANACRADRGVAPAYDEDAFIAEAMEIERLAESYEVSDA